MFSVIIVSIVFGSILALALLICGTILLIVKARNGQGPVNSEDSKIIQELYQGLERLEDRMDSLETILSDSREKEGYRQ